MPDLSTIHETAAAARRERDVLREELRANALRLQTVEAALVEAERRREDREARHDRRIDELRRERDALAEAVSVGRERVASRRGRAIAEIGPLVVNPDRLIEQLDDHLPFVLFPVRIETRFRREDRSPFLLVRVFPDDVAISHHEKDLSIREEAAGQAYWKARAVSQADADAGARDRKQRDAWHLLASRYGSYRASWIAKATTPAGWSETTIDPNTLVFPPLTTKPLSWSDTPRCPILPDRFSVVLVRGASIRWVHGNYVPDDLPLGPDPLQAENFLRRGPDGKLQISGDLRWLIDFTSAEASGMGIRVALTDEDWVLGFDRVLVFGARWSSPVSESSALVAKLFENHRYSRGLSIVPQGAPTNNTEEAVSGRTTAAEDIEETYALEHDPKPFPLAFEPMRQTDGERLARALGLPIATVSALRNADGSDIGESVAMHRVLWGATLGHFVQEMLQGTFSDATVAATRRFFTEFVHGRGLVPAIRVGAQPYGVVVTSAFNLWQWHPAELGRDGQYWPQLYAVLRHLRDHWTTVAHTTVSFVGRRNAQGTLIDPFVTLLDVVGQQASSVEFWSRTGVPETYIKALAAYRNNNQTLVKEWVDNVKNARGDELTEAQIAAPSTATIQNVIFFEETERVGGPLIDGDPLVPLSETALIRPYDDVLKRNYLHWLTLAPADDLRAQRFVGGDGKLVAAPQALLYKMARVATLAELNTGSKYLATRLRPDVFALAQPVTTHANIAGKSFMPAHFTMVDASRIGLTQASQTTGDYLLAQARATTAVLEKPPEAAPLAALTEALTLLAGVSTARLERLLAEHIDTVSYRLDAWLTALFARRLHAQRVRGQESGGSYLGAYGWVENLKPSTTRRVITTEQIPEQLRGAVEGPVTTDSDSGGFVHTPSLPQAVTAAVLRNAYLTHAESEHADRMAVNLSSERVRTALRYLEGLQNGQELAALLGYQIERGLHEGHPGRELDRYIYKLRARFPLISRKLTATPAGAPAEAIEARNVINGYDLLDAVKGKAYPYGLAELPTGAPGSSDALDGEAIQAEIDRLRDALDAVADLLMAESVHQVVQGNTARARGALQALTDGEHPPIPDVVQTPRTGTSLTHRVALFLNPAATAAWPGPLTPRAQANVALNAWLAGVLPAPGMIQWRVKEGTGAPVFAALDSLGLQPIDVVLLSGERLGDFTSALERLIVYDYRTTNAIADDVFTFAYKKTPDALPDNMALIFDPDKAAPGRHSLGSLLPLLIALRRTITASRPLGARDLMRPVEAQEAHPENPQGYDGAASPLSDLAGLKARLDAVYNTLEIARDNLRTTVTAMTPLAKALEDDEQLALQPAWPALIAALRPVLRAIVPYGFVEAMPVAVQTLTAAVAIEAHKQGAAVDALLTARLEEADKLLKISFTGAPADAAAAAARIASRLDAYTRAGQALLGSDYVVVPLFAAHAEAIAELHAAAPAGADALTVESWLQSAARVRPALQAWDMIATCHQWLHDTVPTVAVRQLPTAPTTKWIGSAYGATKAEDLVSIVAHGLPASLGTPAMGLLVDEWTELVPTTHETTGLALHVNRPNAVAPQAILVAVAPRQEGRWSWNDMINVLEDTLERARLRAVEPDRIGRPYFHLLPPIVTAFNNTPFLAAAKYASAAYVAKV